MCCNSHGFIIIPRSDPRFPLYLTHPPTISPNPHIYFPKYPSNHQILRTKISSFKPKSNLNDVVSYTDPNKTTFYELLGIPETGSLLEIKQAYKQLARKYHPDVSPPDRIEEYTERFIRVQEAYETLSDPRMRAMYDRDMAKGIHFAFSTRRRYQNDEMCVRPPTITTLGDSLHQILGRWEYLVSPLREFRWRESPRVASTRSLTFVTKSMEEKGEWKTRWQSQLSELKRRSMHKDSGNGMSWGARMRRQRNEASS